MTAWWKRFLREWGAILGLVVVLGAAFLILHTPAGPLEAWEDLAPHLGTGEPVLLELYSNLCSRCLLSKPAVDGLERDLRGQARLFRVERGTALAMELAGRYQVQLLPALLVFDGQGNLIELQQGRVDREGAVTVVEQIRLAGGGPACSVTPEALPAVPTCDSP